MEFGNQALTASPFQPDVTDVFVETVNCSAVIPTTAGNTDTLLIVPQTGTVTAIRVIGTATLAANGTNFVTFAVRNLGTDASGTTDLTATTDANTTKTSTGSAWTTLIARSLVLSTTPANLKVKANDVLRLRVTGSGTLANTVTGVMFQVVITSKVFQ